MAEIASNIHAIFCMEIANAFLVSFLSTKTWKLVFRIYEESKYFFSTYKIKDKLSIIVYLIIIYLLEIYLSPVSKFLLRCFGIDYALAIFIPKKYFKFFQILPRFFIALMELLLHLTILELSIGASHVRYLLESCLTSSDRNFVHYFLCGDEAHTCPAASDVLRDVFAQQLQIRQSHVSALS